MAHVKSGGKTRLGRDSASQRLGIKASDGQFVHPGMILVRQRGTKYFPGFGVKRAKDDTLYAITSGILKFKQKKLASFCGKFRWKKIISVLPKK